MQTCASGRAQLQSQVRILGMHTPSALDAGTNRMSLAPKSSAFALDSAA